MKEMCLWKTRVSPAEDSLKALTSDEYVKCDGI
jgi:hypothetical protein